MSLIFVDSFDHYVTADLSEKWNKANDDVAITADGGRRSSGGLSVGGQTSYVTFDTSERSTFIVGLAVNVAEPANVFNLCLISFNNAGTVQVSLGVESDLSLGVYRGSSSGGTRLGLSTSGLHLGVWHYVEFKATISNGGGSYTVRIDGTVVLSGTGADTQYSSSYATANAISIGQVTLGLPSLVIDDVYILNTDGATNNDFLGDCRVDALFPSASGATNDWTASAGSNYECVDDDAPNDDTDYVSSSTVDQVDLYAFDDISHTPDQIHGVQVCMSGKNDDSGDRSICEACRSGGTIYTGSSQTLPALSYVYKRQIRETDPATGSAWSKTNLNSAQFGVKIAS